MAIRQLLMFAACALATGVSAEDKPVEKQVGDNFPISIATLNLLEDQVVCFLETPSDGTIQFRPKNEVFLPKYVLRDFVPFYGCSVDVNITGPEDNGIWRVHFNQLNKEGLENSGSLTYRVVVAGAEAVEEDDNTSKETDAREVEYIEEEYIRSYIGAVHQITIPAHGFIETESCHVISPDGEEYSSTDATDATKTIAGLKWIHSKDVACGVDINVDEENMVGNWTLFSRDTRFSTLIERRLPFVIYVEEFVEASPERVTIVEGNNLHIRLAKPPSNNLQDTCKLIDPSGDDYASYELDANHRDACGFVIKNITAMDSGMWRIAYGNKIVYKAPVHVTVTGTGAGADSIMTFALDRPVDKQVGPEDAIYCKVVDPNGSVVFDHFSKCRIILNRALIIHRGTWHLTVGTPGKIITKDHKIFVNVAELARKPRVITHVEKRQPEVLLSCSLPGVHQISNCKFREPSGRVLLAQEGVGEDRYSFHGVNVSLASNTNNAGCGLRITNPVTSDLGLWRCALETSDGEVYYGFLSVLCPWALNDPNVAAVVVTEPILTLNAYSVSGLEGDPLIISCSIQSDIEYCYFRTRNGTTYNLYPGKQSNDIEYYGAGFDAGECGIRILNPREADSGEWSCHVGLGNVSAPEQQTHVRVDVLPAFRASQWINHNFDLVINGITPTGRPLDYCRYVRIDGVGFNEDNLPDGYFSQSTLVHGVCELHVPAPTVLDHHPWTVAARVRGNNEELYGTTSHTIMPVATTQGRSFQYIWILVIMLSIATGFLVVSLATKRNRRWSARQATAIKNSFRTKKTPLPVTKIQVDRPNTISYA